ncbi:hypothetical protein MMSR116_06650 [Methylobacterium mesophilicum SR1.6/6]|uniref:Uncharacterized protein n=1 Tax=Methylobacterium mesophilicum SR1.6/6 TaxID=908290 RepID=A0A6B9FF61_9HYPH|nr:hypothetical protein [Methylobacterium mesophilicum]QGY01611.1 hypothetical protein MMSR116_06650 [Methylobacterium mesophilicum SR1.6/6]
MSRRKSFTKTAITRAVAGMQAAGLKVTGLEISPDKVVIHSGQPTKSDSANPLDVWRAKRDARATERPQ